MNEVFLGLKNKLSQEEYSALEIAVDNYEKDDASFFKVCLECRINVDSARKTLEILRANVCSLSSLCEYIASVKTVYLTDRNLRQKKECSYETDGDIALLSTALIVATENTSILNGCTKEKDVFVLCKCIKLFSDLKFFASETKTDKTIYSQYISTLENKILSLSAPLSKALCPLYLSLYSFEKADELSLCFSKVFSCIKSTKKNTAEILFWSEKGLDVYGYCEQCETLRKWAIDKFLAGDKRFTPSAISEIIINN